MAEVIVRCQFPLRHDVSRRGLVGTSAITSQLEERVDMAEQKMIRASKLQY
jgi:hypothetical protein